MMPSAVVRLPRCMSLLLNCASDTLPYLRSGAVLRSWGRARRGTLGRLLLRVRILRAVEAATALAVLDPSGVERAANDVVLHRRKIRHGTALDEDDRVLLEVVADAGDVGGDLHPVGEANTRDLSQRRVRLLGRHRADDRADTTLLGRATTQLGVATLERVPGGAQGRRIHLLLLRLPPAADELRDRWHGYSSCYVSQGHADAPKSTVDRCAMGPPTGQGAYPRGCGPQAQRGRIHKIANGPMREMTALSQAVTVSKDSRLGSLRGFRTGGQPNLPRERLAATGCSKGCR